MIKKLAAVVMIVILLFTLASCNEEETVPELTGGGVVTVEEYITNLTDERTALLAPQTSLLLHPLKYAINQYGDDYELSWEGTYVRIKYKEAKCAFEVYAGSVSENNDWSSETFDFEKYDIMEYLSFAVIERVVFDVEGMTLCDGISIGMSVDDIAKKLNVEDIDLYNSSPMITTEYDDNGNKIDVYSFCYTLSEKDCIIVFKGDKLSSVEIANYNQYLTPENADAENGKKMITEAFSFVKKKKLAGFDVGDLEYKGEIYSSYYGSWFYGWQFTDGDYKGCIINVEKNEPYRVYASIGVGNQPFLFWCNGKYVDPMLSFLGKWRAYNSNEYIDIKSISEEGIVVFDMYVQKDNNSDEMALLKNVNTVFVERPKNLDTYLFEEYGFDGLGGNVQYFDGVVQTGYFVYAEERNYLSDAFFIGLDGVVQYVPTSLSGRVGVGISPLHIPSEQYEYTQPSTCGYMESFGRDDPNKENTVKSKKSAGGSVINAYLNEKYETEGLEYSDIEYIYLHDYVFPLNNVTYNVWKSVDKESPHYLYVDNTNRLIIKETRFNSVSKHPKELVYKSDMIVNSKTYAKQKYISLDSGIVVDLENKMISKNDSFVEEVKLIDIISDNVDANDRYMFFAEVGERFVLNGYIIFNHTTWGASLHITDSNIPGYDIGVYYLNSEKFFIDPTVAVVGIPDESDKDKYLDNNINEIEEDTKLVIRDYGGKIIGYIYVDNDGKKTVKAFSGKILGYYYPDRNVTTDFSGKILARGDISSALLFTN